jgi:hypothetical protein
MMEEERFLDVLEMAPLHDYDRMRSLQISEKMRHGREFLQSGREVFQMRSG